MVPADNEQFQPFAGHIKVAVMESALDYYTARALLEWQVELGVTEAILDTPLNRYEVPEAPKKPVAPVAPAAPMQTPVTPKVDPVREAVAAPHREDLDTFFHQQLTGSIGGRRRVGAGADGRVRQRVRRDAHLRRNLLM